MEQYSPEEWEILSNLPVQAAIAAAMADGVTVIGSIREFDGGIAAIEAGAVAHPGNALVRAVLDALAEEAREIEAIDRMVDEGGAPLPDEDDVEDLPIEAIEPGTDLTPGLAEAVVTTASPTDAIVALEAPGVDPRDPDELLHEVVANAMQAREILAAKSTPEETSGYISWVMEIVDRVINRARSGGVLGIGGERVAEDEARFRAELAAALLGGSED